MSDENVSDLILERLRRLHEDLRGDVQDLKIRMTSVDEHLPSIQTSIIGLNTRMDRFDERLSRVDLKDAP